MRAEFNTLSRRAKVNSCTSIRILGYRLDKGCISVIYL